jgi:hypothetical protein
MPGNTRGEGHRPPGILAGGRWQRLFAWPLRLDGSQKIFLGLTDLNQVNRVAL